MYCQEKISKGMYFFLCRYNFCQTFPNYSATKRCKKQSEDSETALIFSKIVIVTLYCVVYFCVALEKDIV